MGHQIEYYSTKVTTEKNLKLFISRITGNAYDHGNLEDIMETLRYIEMKYTKIMKKLLRLSKNMIVAGIQIIS